MDPLLSKLFSKVIRHHRWRFWYSSKWSHTTAGFQAFLYQKKKSYLDLK